MDIPRDAGIPPISSTRAEPKRSAGEKHPPGRRGDAFVWTRARARATKEHVPSRFRDEAATDLLILPRKLFANEETSGRKRGSRLVTAEQTLKETKMTVFAFSLSSLSPCFYHRFYECV